MKSFITLTLYTMRLVHFFGIWKCTMLSMKSHYKKMCRGQCLGGWSFLPRAAFIFYFRVANHLWSLFILCKCQLANKKQEGVQICGALRKTPEAYIHLLRCMHFHKDTSNKIIEYNFVETAKRQVPVIERLQIAFCSFLVIHTSIKIAILH